MSRRRKYSEWARPILGLVITALLWIFVKAGKGLPMLLLYAAIGFTLSYAIFWFIERTSKR